MGIFNKNFYRKSLIKNCIEFYFFFAYFNRQKKFRCVSKFSSKNETVLNFSSNLQERWMRGGTKNVVVVVIPFPFYPFSSFSTQFPRLRSTFGLASFGTFENEISKKKSLIFMPSFTSKDKWYTSASIFFWSLSLI